MSGEAVLQVIYRDPRDLTPYKGNARTHSPEQIAQIAASIREFGFASPILLKDDETQIGAGHARREAALLLGLTSVPTITLHGLSESKWRAFVLADNKLALNAGWDEAALQAEIAALTAVEFDTDILGFNADELAALLNPPSQSEADPDQTPEPPAFPVSQAGDVWLMGGHRILCGDSTSAEAVAAVLNGAKPHLCLTDPPYGLGETKSEKNAYDVYDDSAVGLDGLIAGFFPLAQSASKCIVLTPGNANARRYPSPTWTMAWFTPAGAGSGPWGFCCWQPILCYGSDPKLAKGKGRHPDAIVHTETSEKNGHPCAKPINFWSWLMERTSEPGDLIYEPFSGSGTTIIAAEMTGRRCCAIELSPAYVDVAVLRWENFTGKTAALEATGQTFQEVQDERRRQAAA